MRGLPTSTMGRLARVFRSRGKKTLSSAMASATNVRTHPKSTAMKSGATLTPKVRRSTR